MHPLMKVCSPRRPLACHPHGLVTHPVSRNWLDVPLISHSSRAFPSPPYLHLAMRLGRCRRRAATAVRGSRPSSAAVCPPHPWPETEHNGKGEARRDQQTVLHTSPHSHLVHRMLDLVQNVPERFVALTFIRLFSVSHQSTFRLQVVYRFCP